VSGEPIHVVLLEDVAHQTIRLSLVELFAFTGDDSGRVLTAVLENCEPIVDDWSRRLADLGDHTYDATHIESRPWLHSGGFRL